MAARKLSKKSVKKPSKKKLKRAVKSKLQTKRPEILFEKIQHEIKPPVLQEEKPHTFFAVLAYVSQIVNYLIPGVMGLGAVISLLIYFVAQKNFIKFHALQATFLGIVTSILVYIMQTQVAGLSNMFGAESYGVISVFIAIGITLLFLLLALKASKTEWTKIPLFGDIAMKFI